MTKPSIECRLGGDNTDCPSCWYYPDYEWDENELDCMKRKDKTDEKAKK